VKECQHLTLQGLMTIGSLSMSRQAAEGEENRDFVKLKEVKDIVKREVGVQGLELSMGMTQDFEEAIRLGATNVRVGTAIFGERPPKNAT